MSLDANVRIERITELPGDFGRLIALSLQEEFRAVQRMREDWSAGRNRFDQAGEVVFAARAGSQLVGICGLNRDPYLQSSAVGRLRHLYVDPAFRRHGVARALVAKIIERAGHDFTRVRLRTLRSDADQFYVALGFRRVIGVPAVTHELDIGPQADVTSGADRDG